MELPNECENFVYNENDIIFVYAGDASDLNGINFERIHLDTNLELIHEGILQNNFAEYDVRSNVDSEPVAPTSSTDARTSSNPIVVHHVDKPQRSMAPPPPPPTPPHPPKTPPKQLNRRISNIFICDTCNMAFTTEAKLRRHRKTHLYEKPHKCDQCFEEFNVLENLMLHCSLHNKPPFRCPQCGKIFNRHSSLEGHIKSHFKSEYFMCQHCSEMFHYEVRLKEHMFQAHPSENYKLQAEKEAKAKARKLAKGKKLKCQFCEKEFQKNCLLLRHERIHKGERPFKCETCGSAFVQKNSLVVHMLRHTGDRPHQCPHCPQSFTQRGNLVVHQIRCHSETQSTETPYACSQCTCKFKKLGTLNSHISKCHSTTAISLIATAEDGDDFVEYTNVMEQLAQIGRPSQPTVPPIQPPSASSCQLPAAVPAAETLGEWSKADTTTKVNENDEEILYSQENSAIKLAEQTTDGSIHHRMVKQKIYQEKRWLLCIYCPKQFRRPSDLLRHTRIHTKEKPYECPEPDCRRRFAIKSTLTVHMRVHETNPKRHACPICGKSFSAASTLDMHCAAVHEGECGFKCTMCSVAFNTSSAIKVHMRKEHGTSLSTTKPFDIDDFEIELEQPVEINANPAVAVVVESGTVQETASTTNREVGVARTYHCYICNTFFRRKYTLKQHMAGHMGYKPYKCKECGKAFSNSFILKRHLLFHTKERPFTCVKCKMSFSTAHALKRHDLKHSNVRNFMCPYCHKKFKTKVQCRQHMRIHKAQIMKHFKEQVLPATTTSHPDDTFQTIYVDDAHPQLGSPAEPQQIEYIMVFNRNEEPNAEIATTPITPDPVPPSETSSIPTIYEEDPSLIYLELTAPILEDIGVPVLDHPIDNATNPQSPSISPAVPITSTSSWDISTDTPGLHENVVNPSTGIEQYIDEQNVISSLQNNEIKTPPPGPRPYKALPQKCDHCPKVFKKPVDLRRHLRTHTGERPFKCDKCPKAFTLLCILTEHQKVHDDVKQKFPCHICRKSFTAKGSLAIHMRIHAGQKPYKCEYCSLTFRTNGHRKRHERVHLKEAKRLNVNPADVQTKKGLTNQHLQPLLDVAATCIPTFVHTNAIATEEMHDVISNEQERPGDPLINNSSWCNNCDMEVEAQPPPVELKKANSCCYCSKSFKKPSLLERHMVVHTKKKQFPCQLCDKLFAQRASMVAHMVVHNKQKPFTCSGCQKAFNFKNNMLTHAQRCGRIIDTRCDGDICDG